MYFYKHCKLFMLIACLITTFSSTELFTQDAEKKTNSAIYTKIIKTVMICKEAEPIKFDGTLNISTEYAGIQPIQFPCGIDKIGKVYVKQSRGVLFFGFYVPGQFFLKNFVRIAAGTSYNSIATFLYNPYNLVHKTPLNKSIYIKNKGTPITNQGFLAKADAVHKNYWTCEIKINLSELKINAGLLGQQLYLAFALADANEKIYFSRDFQGWNSPATYFIAKSVDNWGKIDKDMHVTRKDIQKYNDHYLALYYIFEKAEEALKDKNFDLAIEHLKMIIELNAEYFFIAYTISDIYNRLEKYTEAFDAVELALRINPYMLEAKVLKGAILDKTGKLNAALIHFRLLFAEYPENKSFALQVGKIYVDQSIQAMNAAKKLNDSKKADKLAEAKKLLMTSRKWFDGLATKYSDDIKILVGIASIYYNADLLEHTTAYILLVQGLVENDISISPSLLHYYCFIRDRKSAEELTDRCIKTAKNQRNQQYERVLELTEKSLEQIDKAVERIEIKVERDAKRKELAEKKLAEINIINKHNAYLRYAAYVFELAREYKNSNMFQLYAKYLTMLYKLIQDRKFPRQTSSGVVSSEKIVAEYMIANIAVDNFVKAAEIYEELKEMWKYKHSSVNNYVTSYADIVKYPKYWEQEKKFRESDAKNNLPVVRIFTEKGAITLELFEDDAPNAVKNFIKNIESGLYKGNKFDTIVKGLIVQAGTVENPPGNIETMPNKRLFFTGTLAMVNEPDVKASENTEFFISLHAIPWLNRIRTVFGRVIDGMDVIYALEANDMIYTIDIIRKRKDVNYLPKYAPKK
ncbi:MAG: peptidylprolyl isomerase [Planctomycetes bacterium]|nr:peptidylprolyl isomerase [Planctomycetota bacterium]